ncbi:hypothetical protein ONZ43_g7545 [Nemania bipapillata]|uniref:Uncharacterized protein n=1 Tax=Nemania bipapillata TaxID=110536 RepID=A0ACC2HQ38_9PEZI|nr:hypothetical protein ONZ43_g7545 [Nemania bipapillata]
MARSKKAPPMRPLPPGHRPMIPGSKRPRTRPRSPPIPQYNVPSILAPEKEAERRERILANTRRTRAKWRPKIPKVRKCNFESFKNRFHSLDEKDYAIDVLSISSPFLLRPSLDLFMDDLARLLNVSGATLDSQIRREAALRRKEELVRMRQSYIRAYGGLIKEQPRYEDRHEKASEERARKEKRAEAAHINDTQIHRVRVQSQPILGHLTALLNDTEQRSTPRTFVRPFKSLVYFQPKMKEILATLEEKWADVEDLDEDSSGEPGDATPDEVEFLDAQDGDEELNFKREPKDCIEDGINDDAASIKSVDSNAEDLDGIMDSVEALRDMRCYVDFVDNEIMPLYKRYDGTGAERVKFDDLWFLFRVGDLIYMPAAGETAGRYHEIWRIYRVEISQDEPDFSSSGWELFSDEIQQGSKTGTFHVYAYYIDHDGNNFGAVRHIFDIDSFVG